MPSSRISILCGKIIEAGWLAAAIIAPLFFDPYSSTVTQTDKIILLRAIAILMLAAWLVQRIEWRDKSAATSALFPTPVPLAIAFLFGAEILSTAMSIAPRISLFGGYHRPDGLEALVTYLIIFAILAQQLRTRAQLNRLLNAIILASVPVALYAIVQRFGLDPLAWSGEDFGARVGSTLGNPIFMAGYLIFPFTLTLARIFQTRANIFAVIIYGAIAFAQTLAIFYSESRGPWVGEFVGLFFFLFLLAILARKYWLARALIALGLGGLAFLIIFNLPNSPLAALRDFPGLGRLGRLTDATASFRIKTWDHVARLVAPHPALQFPNDAADTLNPLRPVLGYGSDTLALVYPQLALPDPVTQSRVTDHSHNETWDALATGGIVGLLAYQFLFLALFLHGLTWLDLIPTRRARNALIGMWFGLALTGAGAAMLLGRIAYLGLAIPVGNVSAVAIYLTWVALQSKNHVAARQTNRADQILMAALLAAIIAHFVETQFGINLVATRTMFGVCAALVWVIGSDKLTAPDPAVSRTITFAFPIALVISTCLFGFIASGEKEPWLVLWRALTFDPNLQTNSYAILALVAATAGLGIALAWTELRRANATAQIAGAVTAGVLLFAFAHSARVSGLSSDPLVLGEQVIWIVNGYFINLFALVLLYAVASTWESNAITRVWFAKRWTYLAMAPLGVIAFLAANALSFDPARADVFYRLAQAADTRSDWNASIALYERAIGLSPSNDAYYMALARAFSEKANSRDVGALSRFGDQTTLKDILQLNGLAPLSRSDWLYATLLTLLRARDLNPLYLDHTLNLARFYIPEPPLDSANKERLATLAEKYFAQAVRIDPNDARVWNEWADFEWMNRNDVDAALRRLDESIARDPKFVETYLALGEIYRARGDLGHATDAYRRALELDPTRADVASKLAFVYYQQGKHSESIAAYQTFISLAPQSPNLWEAHKNLALLYSFQNDLTLAVHEAQMAGQLAPTEYRAQLEQLIARLQARAATN